MNAIDRLRAERPDDFDVESYDAALAAVDALCQAAKDVSGMFPPRTRFGMTPGLIALAAAVRRVEGEHPGLEEAVGPAPTDLGVSQPFESSAKPGITTGSTQQSTLDSKTGWRK